jgi:hypothetical protein
LIAPVDVVIVQIVHPGLPLFACGKLGVAERLRSLQNAGCIRRHAGSSV